MTAAAPGVDLFWLPLGAGGSVVRVAGRAYERVAARCDRRPAGDLYHAALALRTDEASYVVEQAPAWGVRGERGVVATGPVGSRLAGRLALFRYEVRCWRDGVIPDVDWAVDSPQRLAETGAAAERVLAVAPTVPTHVWGRAVPGTGEMWSSNAIIAWLVARAGLPVERAHVPANGRAPGWDAGIALAVRDGGGAPPAQR